MFFREGEKEDMFCMGAVFAEGLVQKGIVTPEVAASVKKDCEAWRAHDPEIEGIVCALCPFRASDCDYQSKNPPRNTEPCGGYIFLRLLLKNNKITLSDLKDSGCEQ